MAKDKIDALKEVREFITINRKGVLSTVSKSHKGYPFGKKLTSAGEVREAFIELANQVSDE